MKENMIPTIILHSRSKYGASGEEFYATCQNLDSGYQHEYKADAAVLPEEYGHIAWLRDGKIEIVQKPTEAFHYLWSHEGRKTPVQDWWDDLRQSGEGTEVGYCGAKAYMDGSFYEFWAEVRNISNFWAGLPIKGRCQMGRGNGQAYMDKPFKKYVEMLENHWTETAEITQVHTSAKAEDFLKIKPSNDENRYEEELRFRIWKETWDGANGDNLFFKDMEEIFQWVYSGKHPEDFVPANNLLGRHKSRFEYITDMETGRKKEYGGFAITELTVKEFSTEFESEYIKFSEIVDLPEYVAVCTGDMFETSHEVEIREDGTTVFLCELETVPAIGEKMTVIYKKNHER